MYVNYKWDKRQFIASDQDFPFFEKGLNPGVISLVGQDMR